jgi:transcriptional regulator with XRE-family HTH domain
LITTATDLKARRRALGITRVQLAQIAGCSPAWLGQIEQGYQPKGSAALDRAVAHLEAVEREVADD